VFLLDTHVWVWYADGDTAKLGRRTVRLLERSAAQDELRVSALSLFEVSWLHATGRLHLSRGLERWIADALELATVRLAPLSGDAAVEAGRAGVVQVPDPVDRLIIGTAREMGATLVTRDRRILQYAADTSAVSAHDAAR
jgi:PIN domain nuclease of toxin-antitoxin system